MGEGVNGFSDRGLVGEEGGDPFLSSAPDSLKPEGEQNIAFHR